MKKNILFIIYSHSLGGGAENILTNVVNNLDKDKYNIDILEYAHYDVRVEPINSNINRLPPVVSMKDDGKIKRLLSNIQVFSIPYFLKRNRKKYDIEISFNYLIPTFLLSGKAPAITWMHGDIYDLQKKSYYRFILRKALRRVNKIVAISERTKKSIETVYPEYIDKIQLVYNGYDIDKILNLSKEKIDTNIKTNSIAFVGRIEDNKNPLAILEAVKLLKQKGKIVNVYFLGKGDLEAKLEQKIKDYDMSEQAFVLGYQINPYPIISKCDAVCMMSKGEGFPTVFAEGLALGVPFISSVVGGVKELSDNGNCGKIVNTIEECASAIDQLVFDTNVKNEMKKNCVNHIEKFSLSNQISQIEKLIDSLT